MKKLIDKTTCIAILVAILLMVVGKPTNAQWATVEVPKQNNTLTWVLVGVGGALIVTTIIILVVKHNKKKASANNFMFNKEDLTIRNDYYLNSKTQNFETASVIKFGNIEPERINFKPEPVYRTSIYNCKKGNNFSSIIKVNKRDRSKKSFCL